MKRLEAHMKIKEVKRQANLNKWSEIIRDRAVSGLTVRQYCREHGITKDQYYYWLKIVREAAIEAVEAQQNALVEIPTLQSGLPTTIPEEGSVTGSQASPCVLIQMGKVTVQVDDRAPVELVKGIVEVMQRA